jgi:hypothetical protein
VQTPRFCGQASIAGTLLRRITFARGLRTSWLIVGMRSSFPSFVVHIFTHRQQSERPLG